MLNFSQAETLPNHTTCTVVDMAQQFTPLPLTVVRRAAPYD